MQTEKFLHFNNQTCLPFLRRWLPPSSSTGNLFHWIFHLRWRFSMRIHCPLPSHLLPFSSGGSFEVSFNRSCISGYVKTTYINCSQKIIIGKVFSALHLAK